MEGSCEVDALKAEVERLKKLMVHLPDGPEITPEAKRVFDEMDICIESQRCDLLAKSRAEVERLKAECTQLESNWDRRSLTIEKIEVDNAALRVALQGAKVLADAYFETIGKDGKNNDNYCRIVDTLASIWKE